MQASLPNQFVQQSGHSINRVDENLKFREQLIVGLASCSRKLTSFVMPWGTATCGCRAFALSEPLGPPCPHGRHESARAGPARGCPGFGPRATGFHQRSDRSPPATARRRRCASHSEPRRRMEEDACGRALRLQACAQSVVGLPIHAGEFEQRHDGHRVGSWRWASVLWHTGWRLSWEAMILPMHATLRTRTARAVARFLGAMRSDDCDGKNPRLYRPGIKSTACALLDSSVHVMWRCAKK